MGKTKIVHLKRSEAIMAAAAILPLFSKGIPGRKDPKPAELEAIRIALVAEYLALVNSLVEGVAPQDAPGGSNLEEPVVETVAPTPPAAAKKKAPK